MIRAYDKRIQLKVPGKNKQSGAANHVMEEYPNTVWIKDVVYQRYRLLYKGTATTPAGATTCSFCLMLASRGPVYSSVAAAGGLGKYHPNDDCQITVVAKGADLPEGYDPEALYFDYLAARKAETATK